MTTSNSVARMLADLQCRVCAAGKLAYAAAHEELV